MKVSIITATYNSAATLRDTLESVKRQTYSNIEHLIIDGGSSDNTLEITEYFPHIARIVSEPDKGIYDAMNKGILNSTGDIIGILNSDDFYPTNQVIEKIVEIILEYKVETVYGDLNYVAANDVSKVIRRWKAGNFKRSSFLAGWMPPHPTFFVEKSIYENYGLFDLTLKSAADYELMLRFLYKNRISTIYIPEVLVHMRAGGQSNASLKNRLLANKEDLLAWKKNELKPKFYTTYLKPIRKIGQFLKIK